MNKERVGEKVRERGGGFCGLLTLLFIGLKLTDNIDWSWLWVLSPIWLPIAVVVGIFVIVMTCLGIAWIGATLWEKATVKR